MAANVNKLDEEVVSVLKVDNKGWNPLLFENESALNLYGCTCLCAVCGGVCDTAAELACTAKEHKDEDIQVHCLKCLRQRIADNDGKCPIDSHEDPECVRNRTIHKAIANLIVFCPYSAVYQQRKRNNDEIAAAANHEVHDTMGAVYDIDEKEGAVAVHPHQQPQQARAGQGCEWKGKLKDLIGEHLAECIKQNDSSFMYKTQIKRLGAELSEKTKMMKEMQRRLSEQEQEWNNKENTLKHQIDDLSQRLEQQTALNQQLQRETQQKLQAKEARISELAQLIASMTEQQQQKQQHVQQEEKKQENSKQPKSNARKFAFNQQPKSQHIQIRNKTSIKNTEYDGKWHSITFGEVIDCVEYKQYRIKFKIIKMGHYFVIGYGANKQALKDVDGSPGYIANKTTTTGIWVVIDNNFYLYDKNHSNDKIELLGGEWTNGWYDDRNGYVFVMEFDFKGKVFSLYDQNNRKLFSLPNLYKSVLPMFTLYYNDDEIEIVECVLY